MSYGLALLGANRIDRCLRHDLGRISGKSSRSMSGSGASNQIKFGSEAGQMVKARGVMVKARGVGVKARGVVVKA